MLPNRLQQRGHRPEQFVHNELFQLRYGVCDLYPFVKQSHQGGLKEAQLHAVLDP